MRILLIPLLLSACASPGYEQYLAANQAVAVSRSNADIARFNALASIASKGDSSASVAAAMALASWMDTCNAMAYTLLGEVQAGTRPLPESTQALIDLLPEIEWPE